jgi:hypothetical protein
MVMGYSVALILMGFSLSRVSTSAYQNALEYHDRTISHGQAASMANMGSAVIYRTPNSFPNWTNVSLGGAICRLETITDPGIAPPGGIAPVNIKLTATSNYNENRDVVVIVWGVSSFGKFAYFSGSEGPIGGKINWATGDTVFGPFHTQDKMTVKGSPVFWGKVTNKLGLIKNPTTSTPRFFGGYQSGVDIAMPSDFAPLTTNAKANGKYLHGKDRTLTFNSDSTMTIAKWDSTKPGAVWIPYDTIVKLRTFVPNGALVIDTANVRIKGKFTGQLTLSVQSGGVSGKGKMYLDSSVAYVNNPANGPSYDFLGLCATDSIVISLKNSGDVTIQAALFSLNKGLGVEQYDNGHVRGRINLLGGIQQKQRCAVGTLNSSGVVNSGYSKSYRYDDRLMTQSPPFYPTTGSYEILSWYEKSYNDKPWWKQ